MRRAILICLASAWLLGPDLSPAQSPTVVFQSAYQRGFAVTDCSNANPIVVTIQAPASNEALSFIPLDNGSLVTITGVQGNTNCNVTDAVINVLTAVTFELTGVAGNGAYTRGGIGTTDTLSDDLPSIPMTNMGQGGHLISVEFPSAMATVTPVQVRIEAADTCPDPPFCAMGDWRPISDDVTEVVDVGGTYYQFMKANGTWRAIRVNSLAATPGGEPMRVDYTGMPFPVGGVVFLGDRFELITPWGNLYPDGGLEFVAGACQNSTASLAFNGGNALPLPEAQCVEDDQELAVAGFDDTTTEAVQDGFLLPPQGTMGNVQVTINWMAAALGTAQWSFRYACLGPTGTMGSINWSSASTVTGTITGANALTVTTMNVPVTGCLASNFFFWELSRTGGVGTLVGDARMKSVLILPGQ